MAWLNRQGFPNVSICVQNAGWIGGQPSNGPTSFQRLVGVWLLRSLRRELSVGGGEVGAALSGDRVGDAEQAGWSLPTGSGAASEVHRGADQSVHEGWEADSKIIAYRDEAFSVMWRVPSIVHSSFYLSRIY